MSVVWDDTYELAAVAPTIDGGFCSTALLISEDANLAIWFRRSPDGIDWSSAPIAVGVVSKDRPLVRVLQLIEHGTMQIVATNGQDTYYTSHDGGRTWGTS